MGQCLVERFIYLSDTQPNIVYAMSMISYCYSIAKEVHLQAVYGVSQYLQATLGKDILLRKNGGLVLETYVDVDYE